jgi:hypothetical protein
MAAQALPNSANGIGEALISVIKELGLPGLLILAVAWIVRGAIPHITKAWTEDRKSRRLHAREKRKIDLALQERQERKNGSNRK